MAKMAKHGGQVTRLGPVEDRRQEFEDGTTVDVLTFDVAIDGAPLMMGLPDGRCQCPHWGYVLSGRLTFQFADREEFYDPGDAFYAEPGHVPTYAAGTSVLQFSPTEALKLTEEVLLENARKQMGG